MCCEIAAIRVLNYNILYTYVIILYRSIDNHENKSISKKYDPFLVPRKENEKARTNTVNFFKLVFFSLSLYINTTVLYIHSFVVVIVHHIICLCIC